MATILSSIPKDANVTKIAYEGPRIALYTNKPRFLMENNEIISNLVNVIKKRIVVRTDEKIRKSEEEARKILDDAVPSDAGLEATFFDTATGEVSIELKRPWYVKETQKNSIMLRLQKILAGNLEFERQLQSHLTQSSP